MNLEALYQEILLDHYRHPRNAGRIEDADVHEHGVNPLCGDEIEVFVKLEGERVCDVRFEARGCSVSRASASMMTELVRGKTLAEVEELADRVERMLRGEDLTLDDDLGDLIALRGVSKFPVRIKCAMLVWKILEHAVERVDTAERVAGAGTSG